MMETVDTIQYRGYSIGIHPDCEPTDPRDWDNLGTMACFHTRYNLGDDHDYHQSHYTGWQEMGMAIEKDEDVCAMLPLILLDHSGLSMSVSKEYPYNCNWDAGQVGFIFASKAQVREEWNRQRISAKLRERVRAVLINEVKTYDMYLRGHVFGWVTMTPDGESLDSCWGYFGDIETSGLMDEARQNIDYHIKNAPMVEPFCV